MGSVGTLAPWPGFAELCATSSRPWLSRPGAAARSRVVLTQAQEAGAVVQVMWVTSLEASETS